MRWLAELLIKFGRRYLRGTWLERSPLVARMYRWVTRIGFGPRSDRIVFRGSELVVDPRDQSMIAGLMNGAYEREELDLLGQLLRPGATFIDVGANIGVYSTIAARLVGPSGHVIAFEPAPTALSLLKRNCTPYKQVEIIPKAAGERIHQAKLFEDHSAIGTSHLSATTRDGIDVPVTTLDAELGTRSIDLIKIDIEGHEREALRGATAVLSRQKPPVLMEFNPSLLKTFGQDPTPWAAELLKSFAKVRRVGADGKLAVVDSPAQMVDRGLANFILEDFRGWSP